MKIAVWISLLTLAFLTACGTKRIEVVPEVVEVERIVTREVPADLVRKCAKAGIPDGMTHGEALEAWAEDRAQLDICNGRLAAIESLGQDNQN